MPLDHTKGERRAYTPPTLRKLTLEEAEQLLSDDAHLGIIGSRTKGTNSVSGCRMKKFGARNQTNEEKDAETRAKARHQPSCMVAHDMINKFSAIIGQCDLEREKVGPSTQYAEWLNLIRNIAAKAVEELKDHQRQVSSETTKPQQREAG